MIANINPREEDFSESLRALNYTASAREIRNIPSSLKQSFIIRSLKIRRSKSQKNETDRVEAISINSSRVT